MNLGGDCVIAGDVEVFEDGGDPRDSHLAHQDEVHQVQRRQSEEDLDGRLGDGEGQGVEEPHISVSVHFVHLVSL